MNGIKSGACLALALCVFSCAKADWNGTYICELDFGSTVPGQAVIVEQELQISSGGCELSVNGYQISEKIVCDTKIKGDEVAVNFVSYANGSVKNAYGVQIYETGETLFALTGSTANPATIWKSMWAESIPGEGKDCFTKQD